MTAMPQQNDTESSPLTIVVTGAVGFIGRRVVEQLLERGVHVCAVDRVPVSDVSLPGGDYQCVDLGQDLPVIPEASVLVHLAWEMDRSNALAQADAVTDFARLLDAAAQQGCRGVVALGSAEEYGEQEGCLSETMAPGTQLSAYGRAKNEACQALEAWAQVTGIPALWLRPFIVYGPRQKGNMVIPYAVRCAQERTTAEFSTGLQYRDFVHVDDVAEGIAQAALRVADASLSFSMCNLGGGHPVQVRLAPAGLNPRNGLDAPGLFSLGLNGV